MAIVFIIDGIIAVDVTITVAAAAVVAVITVVALWRMTRQQVQVYTLPCSHLRANHFSFQLLVRRTEASSASGMPIHSFICEGQTFS